jgi:hypothetical protein
VGAVGLPAIGSMLDRLADALAALRGLPGPAPHPAAAVAAV